MFTFNGVGTRLYGKKNMDADGWYTATKFFCVLWFPVIPLECYRVRKIFDEGNFVQPRNGSWTAMSVRFAGFLARRDDDAGFTLLGGATLLGSLQNAQSWP